jgi:16S rRNA processing protein RimM
MLNQVQHDVVTGRVMPRSEEEVVIGRIVAPFGIRGELKVTVQTDFPERFAAGESVVLNRPTGRVAYRIERSTPNKGGITLKLEGVKTREDAEELRDIDIIIDQSELRELESGRFYVFDIVGLKVVTDDGREQGTVTEVLHSGANDVYVTSTGLCIPALKTVVAEIDLKRGVMVIRAVPGLLPD